MQYLLAYKTLFFGFVDRKWLYLANIQLNSQNTTNPMNFEENNLDENTQHYLNRQWSMWKMLVFPKTKMNSISRSIDEFCICSCIGLQHTHTHK